MERGSVLAGFAAASVRWHYSAADKAKIWTNASGKSGGRRDVSSPVDLLHNTARWRRVARQHGMLTPGLFS